MAPTDAVDLVQARQPTYGARVEMQLGSLPQRGFVADRGFLGLQLEGGARITVRRSGGTADALLPHPILSAVQEACSTPSPAARPLAKQAVSR